eukprot:4585997-Pyramimonas_sp.AAC.1
MNHISTSLPAPSVSSAPTGSERPGNPQSLTMPSFTWSRRAPPELAGTAPFARATSAYSQSRRTLN